MLLSLRSSSSSLLLWKMSICDPVCELPLLPRVLMISSYRSTPTWIIQYKYYVSMYYYISKYYAHVALRGVVDSARGPVQGGRRPLLPAAVVQRLVVGPRP